MTRLPGAAARSEETSRNRRRMQSVRMVDVAREASVSPSTVSLYLRRPEAVSGHAGSRIADAIQRLGYVPNMMAGGLAAAGSRVVSIIVPSLRNAFFAETVSTIELLLARESLQTLVGHTEYDAQREEELVRAALSWAPAGIVLTGLDHSGATRRMLEASAIPVVEMWETGAEPIDINVGISHPEIGAMAARHLVARGRRRLAFLGARLHEDRRAAQRCEGFLEECRALGVAGARVVHPAPAGTEAGSILLAQALAGDREVDGLACSNDSVALGVLFECQRRGMGVPECFSVIGFGDLEFAGFCLPPLTTIRPSGDVIAREVTRILLGRLNREQMDAGEEIAKIGVSLVQRGST